jgi:hypothetical protein
MQRVSLPVSMGRIHSMRQRAYVQSFHCSNVIVIICYLCARAWLNRRVVKEIVKLFVRQTVGQQTDRVNNAKYIMKHRLQGCKGLRWLKINQLYPNQNIGTNNLKAL